MTIPSASVSTEKMLFCTLATAGHVDHGKTSVLRILTGIDPDRLKEEKQRQMTTDLGFAHLRLGESADGESVTVGFIDVPGHGKFLKNMLAGVDGIDMALLVVAADEGPMPQTESHVKILSLLGVRQAIVALTKIDLADENEQESAIASIESLLSSYQIEPLNIVPVSSTKKLGFDELKDAIGQAANRILKNRTSDSGDFAYIPIDRVFNKAGFGLVVTGTVVRGKIAVGDSILVEPGGTRARVRNLETFGRSLNTASAGQRLAVNLALKEDRELHRGLTILGAPMTVSNSLIVRLLDAGPDSKDFKRNSKRLKSLEGQKIRLYHGTAECSGMVRWTDVIQAPNAESSGWVVAQISLEEPTIAEPTHPFIIRYGDEGICGGTVLISSRPRWLTRKKLNELLPQLVVDDYDSAVRTFTHGAPLRVARREQLRSFIGTAKLDGVMERLTASGVALFRNNFLMLSDDDAQLKESIVAAVQKAGEASSRKSGGDATVSLESVRAAVAATLDKQLFQSVMLELYESGRVIRDGDRLFSPSVAGGAAAAVNRTGGETELSELMSKILSILKEHFCIEISEIAKQTGVDSKVVLNNLNALSKKNMARVVAYEFASNTESILRAHQILEQIWTQRRDISPSEFREKLGISRKYVMALLTYFDDNSITRRAGNGRMLLKQAPR